MLISVGLRHLGWEILPGRLCLGPHGPDGPGLTPFFWRPPPPHHPTPHCQKNGVGPSPSGPYGPRQDLPGKISQPRCPRRILINHILFPIVILKKCFLY